MVTVSGIVMVRNSANLSGIYHSVPTPRRIKVFSIIRIKTNQKQNKRKTIAIGKMEIVGHDSASYCWKISYMPLYDENIFASNSFCLAAYKQGYR